MLIFEICMVCVYARINIDPDCKILNKFIKAEIFFFLLFWSSKLARALSLCSELSKLNQSRKKNILSPCLKGFQLHAWLDPGPYNMLYEICLALLFSILASWRCSYS